MDKDTISFISGELYDVEKIIGRRQVNDTYQYRIRWKGYGENEDTWEPTSYLPINLLEEYYSQRGSMKH